MASEFVFKSLAQLRNHLGGLDTKVTKYVYILFTGDKNLDDGSSWCPDCNVADPVIKGCLSELEAESSQFITCFVGDRPTWKNPENEFRRDNEFQIKSVPTLILWKSKKILVEEQCADKSLVQMLFEDAI